MAQFVPMRPEEGHGWHFDENGDMVLLVQSVVVYRISREGVPMYVTDIYDDYLVSGLSVKGRGATQPTFKEWKDGYEGYAYAGTGASINEGWFNLHILHDIKAGTFPTFHVHHSHANASPTGNIKWNLEVMYARGYGVEAYGSPLSLSTVQTAGIQYAEMITSDDDMALNFTPETDSILKCRIWRDPTDVADTFEDDVWLDQIDMHYVKGQDGTLERNRPFTSIGFPST
jgi:hypothetical protein